MHLGFLKRGICIDLMIKLYDLLGNDCQKKKWSLGQNGIKCIIAKSYLYNNTGCFREPAQQCNCNSSLM